MRISLVSTAADYPARNDLANLASVLLRRGHGVHIFAKDAAIALPPSLAKASVRFGVTSPQLLSLPDFRTSDIFIYHLVDPDPLLETLLELDRGAVVLWFQPPSNHKDGALPSDTVRLAAASDLVVVDDTATSDILQHAGAATGDRLHIAPPAVNLAEFKPGSPDADLLAALGLLGRRVLLTLPSSQASPTLESERTLIAAVRSNVDEAVLAIMPASEPRQTPVATDYMQNEGIVVLPATDDLRPYYRLANIFLTSTTNAASRQRAKEAMACGTPVMSLHQEADAYQEEESQESNLAEDVVRLLRDDVVAGLAVRTSLNTAAAHSPEAFTEAWGAAIARACDWLPVRLTPDASSTAAAPPHNLSQKSELQLEQTSTDLLSIDVEQLKTMAGVALRDYEVRSPTPVFGPLIAWVRRNLTSHLRRPYIDPILDQQEAFNLRAVNTLEDLARKLAAAENALAQPSPSQRTVDPQVLDLLDQIDSLLKTIALNDDSRAQIDIIREALTQVRNLLKQPTHQCSTDEER